MKITLTGASGFIGQRLTAYLAESQHECSFVRRESSQAPTSALLHRPEAVIHLAGAPVAGSRWSDSVKKEIRDSRVLATRKLVQEIATLPAQDRPQVIICASAIGFYGERGSEELTEASPKGKGFLSDVVAEWEAEALKAEAHGVRVVCIRLGVVLGPGGGALSKFQPVILGSGQQWMSWIHLDDVIRFIDLAIHQESIRGTYNLTSPEPATNAELTREFARATNSKLVLRTPAFVLKLALGEMSQIVLDSCKVMPKRILETGFKFQFSNLRAAFANIFTNPLERTFKTTQIISKKRKEIFDFFSSPKNLEEITPPWIKFRVLNSSTPAIQTGTLINYQLKIHQIPIKWKTRIESWEPQNRFIDNQVKGPYTRWHHTHTFIDIPNGTLLLDEVKFQVPGRQLGNLVLLPFILKNIEVIFQYRRQKIQKIFG